MATATRICNVDSLFPALSKMLAPVLSTSERIIICVENTYQMGGLGTAYKAMVLTPNYLHYAFQDTPPAGGMRESIALRDISSVERRVTQAGYHQLVIYAQGGKRFTSCEFSPDTLIDMFIKGLSEVGVSVKSV